MTPDRAALQVDLFSDEAIRDPYPVYCAIRDCAPAVWLPEHGVWVLGRYQDVRAALRADESLVSGRGVSLNSLVNDQPGHNTLMSDGELHRKLRSTLMKPMMPRTLAEVRPRIEKLADALVEQLLAKESFDGIADFSRHLPLAVVSHLVGLPAEGRERMLEWAGATFNALGPMNERAQAAVPTMLGMFQYAASLERSRLQPDGWAARLFAAADAGAIDAADIPGLIIDYIGPSLDTTILGTGHLLYLLGAHPEQYDRLRGDPELVPAAVAEALRHGSPVKAFTRFALTHYEAGGVSLPEGDRVLILYGAANRDERHYADPDRFDVTRDARDHLAFGHGVHRCAGGHLAQLEMESLLRAVVARVRRIEIGEPHALMSNMLHGYESFRASFH
jgi:cytochrome P450